MSDLPNRLPPFNLDAEHAVLGAILLEGARALPAVAAQLGPADFYTEANRALFGTMLDVGARADAAVDVVTLQEELRRTGLLETVGGPAYLGFLLERASILANVPAYVRIVREHAILRETIQDATALVARAFDAKDDAWTVLEETRARLERLAARALPAPAESLFPVRSFTALLAAELPSPEFHLQDRIPTKGITFVVGDSEAYKSWFTTYFGLCKAAGRPMFDQLAVRQGPVLLISEENGEVEDKRRMELLARGMGFAGELPFYIASEVNFSFDDPARYAALRAFVAAHAIELLLVDSFIRVHRRKEADAGEMNALYMDRMKPLIKAGVDLVLLHHKRKLPAGLHGAQVAQATSDNDDIRGSGDLRAAAHAVLFLKTQSKTAAVVRQNKARGFKKPEPFVFSLTDLDGGGVLLKHEGKPEEALDRSAGCRAAILEYAGEHRPGFFRQDVITALKGQFSRRVIQPVLKALSKDGYPLKEDELQRGRTKQKFYVLVSADPDPPEPGDDDDVPF